MADRKEIRITVDPSGKVSFKVSGHEGMSCLQATKFLEAALGGRVASQDLTEEAYATAEASATIKTEW